MSREAELLRSKAIHSLLLSINHFNGISDEGRLEAVLIFLDHAFEMLLKGALVKRGARIRESDEHNTIGFDHCVRKALTDNSVKFLVEQQAWLLRMVNNHRDAAQHHLLELSEEMLYILAQSGITIFREILKNVYDEELASFLPERALPISTRPIRDIASIFFNEVEVIRMLLQEGTGTQSKAFARLRSLAITEGVLQGNTELPTETKLTEIAEEIKQGKVWHELFPNVATIEITTTGYGSALEIHLSKDGVPVRLVKEGEPDVVDANVVAVRTINELSFYSLGAKQLAKKVGLTLYKCLAIIWELNLQSDPDYFKSFVIGSQNYKRYSPKAIIRIQQALDELDIDDICKRYGQRTRTQTI